LFINIFRDIFYQSEWGEETDIYNKLTSETPDTAVSSTNKTDCQDITDILERGVRHHKPTKPKPYNN
jgi:hypothetical protein